MTRRAGCGTVVLLLAVFGAAVAVAQPASAASCSAITIAQGSGLTFDVSSVLVYKGGCVTFANLTDVSVSVSVSGSSFSERLPARTPASASRAFSATKSAGVTATDGVRTGHGSITVEKAPVSSPTYVPPPVESSAPESTPTEHSATPTATPSESATPNAGRTHHDSPAASLPALPSLPPGSSQVTSASHPVVAPRVKGHKTVQTATVLDPVGGPHRGLPAAVAVVALLGLGAAFGRAVLAAAPAVDAHRARRPSHP